MPSYIVVKKRGCSCRDACDACLGKPLTPAAIDRHNLRVACHGEREYRPFPPRNPALDWEIIRAYRNR